ncbi:MAG TPA: hypothetical protein VGL92_12365 [Acidimicrobiia bacterium]
MTRLRPLPFRRLLSGAAATVGLVVAATAVSLAWHHAPTRSLVQACCRYSPERLSQGALWTLFGSALLLPRLQMIGPTTIMTFALVVPYALAAGARPALRAFFSGHVLATLAVAAVVVPGAALGWAPAVALRVRSDVGASAGIAAVGGACCVLLGRRRGGPILLAALVAWFATGLVRTYRLVEVEHLVAVATGAVSEWARRRAVRRRARSSLLHTSQPMLRGDGKEERGNGTTSRSESGAVDGLRRDGGLCPASAPPQLGGNGG